MLPFLPALFVFSQDLRVEKPPELGFFDLRGLALMWPLPRPHRCFTRGNRVAVDVQGGLQSLEGPR